MIKEDMLELGLYKKIIFYTKLRIRLQNFQNNLKKQVKLQVQAVWERYAAFAVALGSNKIIKEEIYEKYFNKKV